jgi:adenine-specific DNA-methyltransferase
MTSTLHLGDCLDVMRTMPNCSVDAVVTDPPYYRVKDEDWDRQWDDPTAFLAWLDQVAEQWQRVLKPNGSLYCFASPQMAARVEVMLGQRFQVLNNIRWTKAQGWHEKAEKEALRSYLSPWEAVIFAEQFGDKYAEAEAALHKQVYAPIGRIVAIKRLAAGLQRHQVDTACSPSRKPTGLCYRWEEGACLPTLEQWVDLCQVCGDRRDYEDLRRDYEDLRRPFNVTRFDPFTDVWTFRTVQARPGKHPCEKPQALLRHIISSSTRPGAVVLDSFAGSAATGQACLALGREFWGIERCPRWHRAGTQSLKAVQPDLFAGVAA